jgi:pimeloyl-ACP methyl ester carboxylesterase
MAIHVRTLILTSAFALLASVGAHAQLPISIAKQGYLFAGGKYTTVGNRQVMVGQAYVEYQIPRRRTQPYPIVIIPGSGQTATNFNGTPDGREGWTQFFLRKGYAVYIVEPPGRGRSGHQPEVDGPLNHPQVRNAETRFTATARTNLWPQARLHTQWPGAGVAGDPIFDEFFKSQVPSVSKPDLIQALNRDAAAALLDKIGPAIVMTHSQSGGFGWPIMDARPNLVKALIQIEPSGPPFRNLDLIGAPDYFRDAEGVKPWGLTAVPLKYSPAVTDPSQLSFVQQDKPDGEGLAKCWMQASPARQLPELQKAPILILTGEASFHAAYEHCNVKYLEQAGVRPTWIHLGRAGIHGNGHMMMLEKNNMQVADLIVRWLVKSVPPRSAARPTRVGEAR